MAETTLSVEVAFTTDPLDATPVWVDITDDVRWWDTTRGRNRELERFQPGRATVVLSNLERQYDSVNTAGPHYGYLRPGRRMRIRETFGGVTYPVFGGFVDRWVLNYPANGKDATATITATDLFKLASRTDLPRSVYAMEVDADDPLIWWRLDEEATALVARNSGSLGEAADAEITGPYSPLSFSNDSLVVNDPGASFEVQQGWSSPATPTPVAGGAYIAAADFDLADYGSWAVEMWVRATLNAPPSPAGNRLWTADTLIGGAISALLQAADGFGSKFTFALLNGAATQFGVEHSTTWVAGTIYHVVCKLGASGQLSIHVNGVKSTTVAPGAAGTVFSGSQVSNDLGFGYDHEAFQSAGMLMSNVAVYGAASGDPLSDARIVAHYEAGSAPWQGDTPKERADRILDIVGVPVNLRDLDDGTTTFQSAELDGQDALEHLHKIAESEYGSLLFAARNGQLRFVSRETVFGRTPAAAVYGDTTGEIGYTEFVPDDGDETVRNRATVSRYNGVAKTAVDAGSTDEFGRLDYALDGLLHDTEAESQGHANFVVAEYAAARRRITSLSVGPPIDGEEATVYPAMLDPELGDAIVVRNRPDAGGAMFEQTCVIEGIRHTGAPGGERTVTFTLSPEYSFRDWEDAVEIGYAQVTANQAGISSDLTDLTGLTVDVTVAANRRIRITGVGLFAQSSGSPSYATLYIKEGATQLGGFRCDNPTNTARSCFASVVLTPAGGSHTYKLAGGPDAGTVIFVASAVFPAYILVEDIGPA